MSTVSRLVDAGGRRGARHRDELHVGGLLVALQIQAGREGEDDLVQAEEAREAGVEQLVLLVHARVVDDVRNARVTEPRGLAALRHHLNAELRAVIEHGVLVHVDAVAVEQLLETSAC